MLYSCDHFVEPAHKLGNIGEHRMIDLIVLPQQQALGRAKRDTLPRSCLECDVRASGTWSHPMARRMRSIRTPCTSSRTPATRPQTPIVIRIVDA